MDTSASTEPLRAARLGETPGEIPLEGREVVREAVWALSRQARDRIWIAAPRLDLRIFGDPRLESILSAFLRAHRRARVRVLVQDARALARVDHPLLRLSQRLSSRMAIRRQSEDFAGFHETWLLADEAGLMRMPHPDRYTATAWFSAAQELRELSGEFEIMWASAVLDPDLRRLGV